MALPSALLTVKLTCVGAGADRDTVAVAVVVPLAPSMTATSPMVMAGSDPGSA